MGLKVFYKDSNSPVPKLPLTPGVCAVIQNDKYQILLHKRSDNDLWTLPGGKMKIGESISECCKREIKEELNLNIKIIRIIGLYTSPDFVFDFGNDQIFQPFVVAFLCKSKTKDFQINSESTNAKWFDLAQISKLDVFPYTEKIISHALGKKETFFD
jgi:ADP-ribose pyrophosphatase YjhB (NUDIX family)